MSDDWKQHLTGGEAALLSEKPPLNRLQTVDGLIRGYLVQQLEARSAFHGGAPINLPEKAAQDADALSTVFFGQDPAYQASAWNSPEQLGAFLVRRLNLACGPAEAPKEALLHLATYVHQLAGRAEAGEAPDTLVQTLLDGAIREGAEAFLGIPDTSDEQQAALDIAMRGLDEGDVTV